MRITDIQTRTVEIPLLTPFKTALRTVNRIENVLVAVQTDEDLVGFGAAAPSAVITGDTAASIIGGVAHIREQIAGMDLSDPEAILRRVNGCIVGNTSAKAAVDMAVHDLWAKSLNVPLYRLLGGSAREIHTDMTVSLDSPEKMTDDSRRTVAKGFRTLKIKVGNDPDLDIRRVSAIWEAVGPDTSLCIDANQGWTPKQAVRVARDLERRGIDVAILEQPVRARDYQGLKFVRDNTLFPVYADESVFSPADALKLIAMDAVDGLNIKLMKCGGIANALKIAAIAESAGLPCMIGSMMESAVSVTAAAHVAASRSVIQHCDLDAPLFCSRNPAEGGIRYDGSKLVFADGPGLGITAMEA